MGPVEPCSEIFIPAARAWPAPVPRDFGQPNLDLTVDRRRAARFGINVADIQDAIQTAVGGNAVSQVLIGEQRYDVVVRYQAPYRNTARAIRERSPGFTHWRARVPGAVD